jgi:hypothetical protein
MKYLIIVSLLCLSACSTPVPVSRKFPDVPKQLLEKCPVVLKQVEQEQPSIVDMTKVVVENYTTYHECAVKYDSWIEWYQIQKHIFEDLK